MINIDWLKEMGLVKDFSGLHNLKDLKIIQHKMANISMTYKMLDDTELVMSSY
jgi:hypothetical protein